jgi:hypothetical protein
MFRNREHKDQTQKNHLKETLDLLKIQPECQETIKRKSMIIIK